MMQNSLGRLFEGMTETLRDVVMPATADDYVRAQLSACIEILANLSTRVEWSGSQLEATTLRARDALESAAASAPALRSLLDHPPTAGGPLAARNNALARISDALRACDDLGLDETARGPLLQFCQWHVETELELLRTGMYST